MRQLASVAALLLVLVRVHAQQAEKDLGKALLDDYDKRFRPVRNARNSMNVSVRIMLLTLLDDSHHEQVNMQVLVYQNWTDEFLRWNPTEWNNLTAFRIPLEELWQPDTQFSTSIEIENELALRAHVNYKGLVRTKTIEMVRESCELDVSNFPFDNQTCKFWFVSLMYSTEKLRLNFKRGWDIPMRQHPEWKILDFRLDNLTLYEEEPDGEIVERVYHYYLLWSWCSASRLQEIERQPLYYVAVIIFPSFLIIMVSIVGVFAPHSANDDREEKVSLGLTTLLAMSVIVSMIAEQIPRTSKGLPLLSKYVLLEMVVMTAAILVSVFFVCIHERMLYMGFQPPEWLCRLACMRYDVEYGLESFCYHAIRRKTATFEKMPSLPSRDMQKLVETVIEIREEIEARNAEEGRRLAWQRLFSFNDLILMIVFIVFNLNLTLFMFKDAMARHEEFGL